ncbi:MAG TPA: hypothetical protein GXX35_13920 [Thermoanaerobacterales bacterium]|nr:hypothetical protein [Thermoanaerobacterales bacterium]
MSKVEKVLTVLLIVSVALSAYLLAVKISVEQANKKVEISVPAREVSMLAVAAGKEPEDVLRNLKASGVTTLAVEETTVKDLQETGRILILNGWQLLDHKRFLGVDSLLLKKILEEKDFNPKSYYVFIRDVDTFKKLLSYMKARRYEVKSYAEKELYIIQEVQGRGGFSSIGLGFDESSFKMADALGLNTAVMIKDVKQKTPQEMNSLLGQLNRRDVSILIPQGNEVPSNPESARILKNYMQDHSINMGFDEFLDSEKLKEIISQMDYSAIRVYNRPAHKWMDEYLLAVRDRNDRLLYLHLFLSGQKDIIAYNMEHVGQIKDIIVSRGFELAASPGRAESFKPFYTSSVISLFTSTGILWALWKLMKIAGIKEHITSKAVIVVFILFNALAALNFALFRDAAGLLAAVCFPVLGIYAEMKRGKSQVVENGRPLFRLPFYGFLRPLGITLMGAAILWGISGGTLALLGLQKFRGIKALYIFSYGIVILLYLKDIYGRLSLKKPILSLGSIILLLLFTGVLFVLINRTGNDSIIPIPKWELSFRIWLENTLWVRPRTKEFLMGFPALMVAEGLDAMGYDRWAGWFYLAALLGPVSMMNTFSHFHIAALISIVRSLEGAIIGAILGAVALGGFYLYERRRKGYNA